MLNKLREFIELEAIKHATRFNIYHNYAHIDYLRNKKRITNAPPKKIYTPDCWKQDKKFNPFYVLKNLDSIALSINKKFLENDYKPHEPYVRNIPKKGGGERSVSTYQIPDAAVSTMLYSNLLAKNKHRFSSLSYAYRNDKNVHFAIQDIGLEFQRSSRLFVSEFDFSDFFGSINHEYLYSQFEENGFYISDFERNIIKSFLDGRSVGVPQGTSISLFLANLVCWKLDKRFEEEGLRFARYADDTVIWSRSYEKICKSFEIIENFSKESKVKINLEKSAGISLLTKDKLNSEIKSHKSDISFLGYSLSTESISIKPSSIRKIKKQISYLLYRNLIQPYSSNKLQGQIVPNNGKDSSFVTAIMQIRRYLYGGLSEVALKKYMKGEINRIQFKGVMSYYPLVNDIDQLKELDKWLVCTILKVLRKRESLLKSQNKISSSYNQFPFNLDYSNIIKECRNHVVGKKVGLTQIPSFLRIHGAINLGLINEGIGFVINPTADSYNYDE